MQKLDECLAKTRRIKELEEEIEEIRERAMSPRNQIITGMPRSSGGQNQSESYIVMIERREAAIDRLTKNRDQLWDETVDFLRGKNVNHVYIMLLRYRFYCGLPWQKCCDLMCEEDPTGKWNINKVFRVYRSILRKFTLD